MWKRIQPYVISAAIALGIGGLSALLTKNNMDLYDTINKPALSPPMVIFPIVWGILFFLMGISSAAVWIKSDKDTKIDNLWIYMLQIAVNFFWSIIFFNMRAFLFAFIWLVILWILIIAMIIKFRKISRIAAYLQIPYLVWVTFAGYLTFMIYFLNG